VLPHQGININRERGDNPAIATFGVKIQLILKKIKTLFIAGSDNLIAFKTR
jgi:hypothetical protein